jgi:hypothetical protein
MLGKQRYRLKLSKNVSVFLIPAIYCKDHFELAKRERKAEPPSGVGSSMFLTKAGQCITNQAIR